MTNREQRGAHALSGSSFQDLDVRQRRRLVARSALKIVVSTLALFAVYATIPVAGETGTRAVLELVVGLLLFAAILAWQVRRITTAEHPELRAAEALVAAVVVGIIVFAFTYLSLWRANHASFTEPLNHVGAIYFTVTVISTAGFGDIAAKTDAARVLVTFQILLDLALAVAIARAFVFAARIGLRRQHDQPRAHPDEPAD
jgi:voltage-gated potassium channel